VEWGNIRFLMLFYSNGKGKKNKKKTSLQRKENEAKLTTHHPLPTTALSLSLSLSLSSALSSSLSSSVFGGLVGFTHIFFMM
jgi:hypothetical protein